MGSENSKEINKFHKEEILTILVVVFVLSIVLLPNNYFFSRTKILMSIAVLYCICRLKMPGWISLVMTYSFWIYATHGKLLSAVQIICTKTIEQSNMVVLVEYLFLPVFIVVICVLFGKLTQKCYPRIYSILTGGR